MPGKAVRRMLHEKNPARSLYLAFALLLAAFKVCANPLIIDLGVRGYIWPPTMVSAHGNVVVGTLLTANGERRAYRYTADGTTEDLVNLPGGKESILRAISADGSVIVGDSISMENQTRAFRYTDVTGMVDLGTLGGGFSSAIAVSANGAVIVGNSTVSSDSVHAFKYENGRMFDLGTLNGGGAAYSIARAVSADGSVIIGDSSAADTYNHAFKYTDARGMQDLGTLGGNRSFSNAVSADGSVIIGSSELAGGAQHAYKYTDDAGMKDLGTLGGLNSFATALSADGTVIVGGSGSRDGGHHAFKYTDKAGMQDLGTLGGTFSDAYAVSANGAVIVGKATLADGNERAFRYTDKSGMQDLGTLGGMNSSATGISADGRVIVGLAETGKGEMHAALWMGETIIDADNSVVAIGQTARQARKVLDLRNAQLQLLMRQDCEPGARRFCIAAGTTFSRSGNARKTGANLVLAYRLTPQWHIGLGLGQDVNGRLPDSYRLATHKPAFALYARFDARKGPLGWQLRLAAAAQKSTVDIRREELSNTEAGSGRASLSGRAFSMEGNYGFAWLGNSVLEPYIALNYSKDSRGAYTETSGAELVGKYAAMGRSAGSVEAGLRFAKIVGSKLTLVADAGMVRDFNVSQRHFKVAVDYLGNYRFDQGRDDRTRIRVSTQANYELAADSTIQGGVYWAQQAYGNRVAGLQLSYLKSF